MESKLKIAIIDDDDVCNMLSIRMLKKTVDADFLVYNNPEEALDSFVNLTRLPDYILLDILMPEMDGFQFLDRLKDEVGAAKMNCKVIILTSSIRESDKAKALSFNCITDYVNKPLDPDIISKVFEKHLIEK